MDRILQKELDVLSSKYLRRKLRKITCLQGVKIESAGRTLLNFASNDYLGLAGEEFLKEAAARAAKDFGAGSGSARLISGTLPPHTELEETLAYFKCTEAALAFACGFSTAVGTIPALVGKSDVVILDKLSHACLVDGARLSGAKLRVFPHNDCCRLASHLQWARTKFPNARILVVTESVFSMDGDLAPLGEIVELKEKHGAWLLVDEAHGVGVLGNQGRGLVDFLGLGGRVEIQMGTLGKALGAAGGYIAGSQPLVDLLINRARSFIFSTAPPPSQAAAASAALRWILTDEGSERLRHLTSLRSHWNELQTQGMQNSPSPSAIVPVPVGAEDRALQLAAALWDEGFFVPAIRYPVVARGHARLRVTLTAAHSQQHLDSLWRALTAIS